ncbi:MAG TPA: hypothetical protein VGF16_09780 [Bryobacteraceae bacterium]
MTTQPITRKRNHLMAKLAAILLLSFGLAKADRLDTTSYNFQLNGGGGGSAATLNLTTQIEIFCNDFNNDIYVPVSNYSANLTTFTAAGMAAGNTRFGAMDASGFKTISLTDTIAQNTINAANGLARYEMAAYLVSQYDLPGGNDAANNNLQMAIWELLDPISYPDPLNVNPSAQPAADLALAGDWYYGTTEAQREAYLQNYRIVSDATMTCPAAGCGANAPKVGGFQEQITRIPEVGSFSLLALGLIGIAFRARRRRVA